MVKPYRGVIYNWRKITTPVTYEDELMYETYKGREAPKTLQYRIEGMLGCSTISTGLVVQHHTESGAIETLNSLYTLEGAELK